MEQSPGEADSNVAGQEIFYLSWTQKAHHRFQNSSPHESETSHSTNADNNEPYPPQTLKGRLSCWFLGEMYAR
jgi:hypothetical protein